MSKQELQDKPDERLIIAAIAGDDGAFACLVTRHKRRVFSLVSRFARDNAELEDICQEVFIKAYENLSSFRRDAPFEHWLTKIAVNICHDTLRRRGRTPEQVPEERLLAVPDSAAQARHDAREAQELLSWAMSFLKPDERTVITLMELEEMTLKETSELTGWSEANIKVRAHRARQALKRVLEVKNGG